MAVSPLHMKRILSFLWLVVALNATFAAEPNYTRNEVIYGRKNGMALTMDIITPKENANGLGLVFVVSGGWRSNYNNIQELLFKPMTDRGYTVFAIMHGEQPKFIIPEIVQDLHRGVRYVRHHAAKYKINPEKIGIYGFSAGGHLSLTMGVKGGPGDSTAKDPIDAASSAVQAVACFYPPTDFLNYNKPGDNAVGVGTLANYKGAFGSKSNTPEGREELGREISPLYYLSEKTPPTLIVHGDADALVPIYQAELFVKKCEELKVPAELIRKPGKKHGWPNPEFGEDVAKLADWFDKHLRGK